MSWIGDDRRVAAAVGALGHVAPTQLADTRRWLHFALQPLAAHGFTAATPSADYRHTAGHWVAQRRAIEGEPAESAPHFHVGLELDSGTLTLRDEHDAILDRFAVAGATLDEAYRWYHDTATRVRGRAIALIRPAHDLSADPLGAGARFPALAAAAAHELASWFELADATLACVALHEPAAGPRRVWPHHFDLATLVELGGGRSIGIGLSPGDASYDEPYFYATPWPYPLPEETLPDLPGGAHWHREGWTGAVLTGTTLACARDRVELLDAWLQSSHAALRALV